MNTNHYKIVQNNNKYCQKTQILQFLKITAALARVVFATCTADGPQFSTEHDAWIWTRVSVSRPQLRCAMTCLRNADSYFAKSYLLYNLLLACDAQFGLVCQQWNQSEIWYKRFDLLQPPWARKYFWQADRMHSLLQCLYWKDLLLVLLCASHTLRAWARWRAHDSRDFSSI